MLALGDSYTIGESVSEDARWPNQLAAMLRDAGVAVAAPEIVARTGWTTDELSAELDRIGSDLVPPYDLVSLLIGVNNQYRGRSLAEYGQQFEALLQRAMRWAGGQGALRVLSIPDWGVTPFARDDARSGAQIGAEIDAFNRLARTVCDRYGVAFIDVTESSREAAGRPELLCADGLHPSALEYARWASQFKQTLNRSGSAERIR
jgi:lysophospholipase L1-like esterase